MAASRYDAIIIGGGHNGLVCGSYLAKAGLKVLVLERRHIFGGAAVTEEFAPGFRASIFSYVMSILHPRIIADLELRRFGLEVLPANDLFCPLWNDDHLIFSADVKTTQANFARFSRKDAEAYPAFDAYLQGSLKIVRPLLFQTPVDPTRADWAHLKETARLAWEYRKIGTQFYRIVDLLTQSADDYLSQWFESDVIKAVFAYYASIGTFAGPKTPGSAYVLLHHLMGEHEGAGGWGFIKGGMGTITQAIAQSGARFGLEVKTDSPIAQVLVSDGQRHRRRDRGRRRVPGRPRDLQSRRQDPDAPHGRRGRAARGLSARPARLPDLLDRVQDQRRLPPPAAIHGLRPRQGRASTTRPTSTSRPTSSISSAPTTTPSTAPGPSARSSRRSCRRSATTRSPRPASTWSTCSAATRPTS